MEQKQRLAAQVTETLTKYMDKEVSTHIMENEEGFLLLDDDQLSQGQLMQMNHLAQQIARQVDKIVDKRRVFHCVECAKTFPQKWGLTRHTRTHTGLRPHACTICDKSFTQLCALRRHEQIHDAGARWQCEVCQKNFKLKEYLQVHVKSAHS
jgi:hypothetical protein